MFLEMHGNAAFHRPAKLGVYRHICTIREKFPYILSQNIRAWNTAQLGGFVIKVRTSPLSIEGSETIADAFEDISDPLTGLLQVHARVLQRKRHGFKGLREHPHLGRSLYRYGAIEVAFL